jgi:hypothetical protein
MLKELVPQTLRPLDLSKVDSGKERIFLVTDDEMLVHLPAAVQDAKQLLVCRVVVVLRAIELSRKEAQRARAADASTSRPL